MRIVYNSNIVITGTLLENSRIYKGKIEVAGRKKIGSVILEKTGNEDLLIGFC